MFRFARRLRLGRAATHGARNAGMRTPVVSAKPSAQVQTATQTQTQTATKGKFDYRQKLSSAQLMEMEHEYAAHNYHPLPVVWERANGVHVFDPEGKRYFDFLSAYSATNQGHCHPKIVAAAKGQLDKMTLSSRAFYNDAFPRFAKFVSDTFGYESMLPANTGVEAVEGALKMARKWGYEKKRIPAGQALIMSACGCFHGRTFGAISMSCDPEAQAGFEPMLPGQLKVTFDDIGDLEQKLKTFGKKVAAFIVEPIQGEAGVYVPTQGYLKAAAELCKKHDVLLIADEIQTGLGRTGRLLASDYESVRPDVVLLGKALGGGLYPISAVLADKHIMDVFTAGTHGSTFGGNPMAAAIGMASLEVLLNDGLIDNAYLLGEHFRSSLRAINSPLIKLVRGRGLLNAFVVDQTISDKSAWDLCLLLKHRGLLAKPTHDNIIRMAPPLTITRPQLDECLDILKGALNDIVPMDRRDIPGASPTASKHAKVLCKTCGKDLS